MHWNAFILDPNSKIQENSTNSKLPFISKKSSIFSPHNVIWTMCYVCEFSIKSKDTVFTFDNNVPSESSHFNWSFHSFNLTVYSKHKNAVLWHTCIECVCISTNHGLAMAILRMKKKKKMINKIIDSVCVLLSRIARDILYSVLLSISINKYKRNACIAYEMWFGCMDARFCTCCQANRRARQWPVLLIP